MIVLEEGVLGPCTPYPQERLWIQHDPHQEDEGILNLNRHRSCPALLDKRHACLIRQRPWGRPGPAGELISLLAWEHQGNPQKVQEFVAWSRRSLDW